MPDDILGQIEHYASTTIENVSDFLGFGGSDLQPAPTDGTVTLPHDLFAKPDVQTEWWYYTGHCHTQAGREFGFELVFFKRRTDLDKLGLVPMTAVANPMYFAHFAVSDIDSKTFRYEHLRSFNKPFDVPVAMSETACDVRLGPWSLREVAGKHILHGTFEDGFVFDAILESYKPIVLNGNGGITQKKDGASKHFSYTRMKVSGQTSMDGKTETFTGSAWMDREFGIWQQGNWDWFSIQFDDETELMIYQFSGEADELKDSSTGTFVNRDGSCVYLKRTDYEIEVLATWISEKTQAEYPSRWRVRAESLGLEIEIEPLIDDQELDTRGSTMIVYWEGACSVVGTKGGNPLSGRAYVELVGYDRSHESAGITDFLFGGTMKKIQEMFA